MFSFFFFFWCVCVSSFVFVCLSVCFICLFSLLVRRVWLDLVYFLTAYQLLMGQFFKCLIVIITSFLLFHSFFKLHIF